MDNFLVGANLVFAPNGPGRTQGSPLRELSDSELILHAYLKWEEDCVSHLLGDFVFALHDPRKEQVFCGRDHLGVRPLYYYLSPRRFVCATTLSALIDLAGVPGEIEQQWLADYLLSLSKSFDRTPYRGLLKLPPAHCLSITQETQRLRQYFRLGDVPPLRLQDSREYVDAYREQLEAALKCRVKTEYPLGSELSGGLDSSTVTAYAARLFDQPLSRFHAFGFVLAELDREYILTVSRALGLPQTHILPSHGPGEENLVQRSLKILGYPSEHGINNFYEPLYRLAATLGVRTLLSGFGGDEFVTTIHGYLVPLDLITRHRYQELYQRLRGNGLTRLLRLIRLGLQQIRTRNFTRPDFNLSFFKAYTQRWEQQIVRREWMERYNLQERYLDEARFDAGYTDLKKFTLEKRWLPFVPTRLENCTLMAAARKIEYRWPLLDVRLVRLFLSIPAEEHFYRGMGRYLHRRAIQGVVPDLVTWKRSKGMGNIIRNDQGGVDSAPFAVDKIHPRLLELIDVEKLREQIATGSWVRSPDRNNLDFQKRRNLRLVRNLDLWLKQRFPIAPPDQGAAPGHNLEA
jgi:asparagine synthase (glutamine-hydrolysing)